MKGALRFAYPTTCVDELAHISFKSAATMLPFIWEISNEQIPHKGEHDFVVLDQRVKGFKNLPLFVYKFWVDRLFGGTFLRFYVPDGDVPKIKTDVDVLGCALQEIMERKLYTCNMFLLEELYVHEEKRDDADTAEGPSERFRQWMEDLQEESEKDPLAAAKDIEDAEQKFERESSSYSSASSSASSISAPASAGESLSTAASASASASKSKKRTPSTPAPKPKSKRKKSSAASSASAKKVSKKVSAKSKSKRKKAAVEPPVRGVPEVPKNFVQQIVLQPDTDGESDSDSSCSSAEVKGRTKIKSSKSASSSKQLKSAEVASQASQDHLAEAKKKLADALRAAELAEEAALKAEEVVDELRNQESDTDTDTAKKKKRKTDTAKKRKNKKKRG